METGVPYFPKSTFLQSAARFAKVLYLAKYYVSQKYGPLPCISHRLWPFAGFGRPYRRPPHELMIQARAANFNRAHETGANCP